MKNFHFSKLSARFLVVISLFNAAHNIPTQHTSFWHDCFQFLIPIWLVAFWWDDCRWFTSLSLLTVGEVRDALKKYGLLKD